ncbi:hypothetical protein BDN72DRAFT_845292 [Pluteus cervinus]|uniref:Uncharacterized protein n=1 Tax=Pluteus cervinus TaxID=181527 RepID=A0ACD3AL38_9AGAR|nr:hypothetical protein BDN72DRAFT_845292 [Pluteus cervinus]
MQLALMEPQEAPPQPTMSSNTTPKPKKPRVKNEGTRIMAGYWDQGIANPNEIQRLTMLAEIHAIPGCEQFSTGNLKAWFTRQRKKARESISIQDKLAPSPLYPSLAPASLLHLGRLAAAQPDPSRDVIMAWASVLHATPKDIGTWLKRNSSTLNKSALPTPEPTASPTQYISNLDTIDSEEDDPMESPLESTSGYADPKVEPPSPMLHPPGLTTPRLTEEPHQPYVPTHQLDSTMVEVVSGKKTAKPLILPKKN